ncbi:hypothetical protein CYY_001060 [Polysphondylium violaceum]|uniref:Paramecium surface antigen repeat-containing protein n=1 Tax=Polysphondylium violaceum TaxID=133409 RepID=A0A8J4V896_9MYCE|nr:hypothetical protein CYY_001060 [Polysphondylium violaceum]
MLKKLFIIALVWWCVLGVLAVEEKEKEEELESSTSVVPRIFIQECFVNLHAGQNCALHPDLNYDLICDMWSYCSEGRCEDTLEIGSTCQQNVTKCNPNSYCSSDSICVPHKSVLLNGNCQVDRDCIGNNTICSSGKCVLKDNICVVDLDCQAGYYCKFTNIDIKKNGTCAPKHLDGACVSSSECSYPKICGYENNDSENKICMEKLVKNRGSKCADPYECEIDHFCRNGTCATVQKAKTTCKSSCDCDEKDYCSYDMVLNKQVCKNWEQIWLNRMCTFVQKDLTECAHKNSCPYENQPEIKSNDCILDKCDTEYKRYTDQCTPYQKLFNSANNLGLPTFLVLVLSIVSIILL